MFPRLKNISLKTKMALSISLLFVTFGAIMAWFTLFYFERKYDDTIARQQYALASALAFSIDNKLTFAQNALVGAAARITPEIAQVPTEARRFLDNRPTLLTIFDDGIFLISKEGDVIAESSGHPHQQGENKPFGEFYRKTRTTGKPYVSNHYVSPHRPGNPAVFMTAPLFNSRGEMYAILGGSIDLQGNNLLEEFSRIKIGKTGYLALCDRDRTIIVHPDKKRVQRTVPEGVNKLFDRAVAGFEGSGKTVNSRGVGMLTSIKQLTTNDWFVVANLPLAEAYASLYEARRYLVLATLAGTSAILVIAWLMMRGLTAPLMAITRHVQSLPKKSGRGKLIVGMDRGDEIGTLAEAFNEMITSIEMQHQDLESFSYSLSHDLKTPLTGISVAAQCLADDYAGCLDENGKFFVESINTGCERINQLIDAMLALSRLTQGEVRSERVDLSQLARKVVIGLRMAHPERQVECAIAEGLAARGDQHLLEVALENLIGNAWKYSGRAKDPVIEFGTAEVSGEKVFFVRDNGAGFDMAAAGKLFLPFQRLHREEEFAGTGIGLATVQKIMIRHGGKVWAEGEPGRWATFYFTLPEL